MLADSFAAVLDPGSGSADLAELGVHYVRFALEHPAHFQVMYDADLGAALDGREPTQVFRQMIGLMFAGGWRR